LVGDAAFAGFPIASSPDGSLEMDVLINRKEGADPASATARDAIERNGLE
jgi:hypothetical protein